MKTMLKFTVVTGIMFATLSGTAMGEKQSATFSDTEREVLEAADKGNPIFRKEGDKIYLNMLNLQGDKVFIKVIDSNGRALFNETSREDLVEKAFNFENATADRYTVYVKDSKRTYSEKIVVK